MNRHIIKALFLTAICAVSSCSDEVTAPDIYPEQATAINLGVNGTSSIRTLGPSRSSEGYIDYNPRLNPTTMGAFGFKHDKTADKWYYIFFKNTSTPVTSLDFSAGHVKHTYRQSTDFWEYADDNGDTFTESWNSKYDRHVFFAYMPYQPDMTVNGIDYHVTLKQIVTNRINLKVPLIEGISNIPYLICHEPVIRDISGADDDDHSPAPFKMDQIMQQFVFLFKLDPAMGDIRHFHITSVELFGKDLPASASFSRNYNYSKSGDAEQWTTSDSNYDDYVIHDIPEDDPFLIVKPVWKKHSDPYYLPLSSSEYRYFGVSYGMPDEDTDPSYFYVIQTPTIFTPSIKVRYSIFDDNGFLTRSGAGTIILSNKYFDMVDWTDKVGYCHEIKINIVPNRLYILSDADQAQGYLVLD